MHLFSSSLLSSVLNHNRPFSSICLSLNLFVCFSCSVTFTLSHLLKARLSIQVRILPNGNDSYFKKCPHRKYSVTRVRRRPSSSSSAPSPPLPPPTTRPSASQRLPPLTTASSFSGWFLLLLLLLRLVPSPPTPF